MYESIQEQNFPAEVEAAWLHHRYVQIHPFQDGNGRSGRLLMAYAYIRRGKFPPVISANDKPAYIDRMELADQGNLYPLARYFGLLATLSLENAITAAEGVLEEKSAYHHPNGKQTFKKKALRSGRRPDRLLIMTWIYNGLPSKTKGNGSRVFETFYDKSGGLRARWIPDCAGMTE